MRATWRWFFCHRATPARTNNDSQEGKETRLMARVTQRGRSRNPCYEEDLPRDVKGSMAGRLELGTMWEGQQERLQSLSLSLSLSLSVSLSLSLSLSLCLSLSLILSSSIVLLLFFIIVKKLVLQMDCFYLPISQTYINKVEQNCKVKQNCLKLE